MQLDKLKEEVEKNITATFLETKLTSDKLAKPDGAKAVQLTPKQVIEQWIKSVETLEINGVDDKVGYKKVTDQIALARTTRTTLEKNRKQEKSDYLEAGRVIDGLYKGLISEIEPTEELLQGKKKVIDDLVEAEKERKANEKRLKGEARSKQLIDLKFVFTGAGYHLQNVTIANAEIEMINDEMWEEFINGSAKEAFDLQVKEEQEVERLKQEEENRRVIAERTERRKQQLLDNGFNHVEGMYVRPNQSEKFKAVVVNQLVSGNVITDVPDEVFTQIIANAKEDTEQAKTEFNEKLKAFQLSQQQQQEKEAELARKEEELKRQQEEQEQAKKDAIKKVRVEELKPYIVFIRDYSGLIAKEEAEYQKELAEIKIGAEQHYKAEGERLAKEAEEQEKERQMEIAREVHRREKQKKEFELAEQKRLAKLEKAKPEKQKLLEYAGKLEAIEFPKLKELKEDGQVFQSRVADIVADIKELCK